jgi:hypothetical protein
MSTPATTPAGTVAAPGPDESRDGPWRGPGGATVATLVVAVLRRPDLWWTALGELRRLTPRLWWRTAPHLPLPDRRLWEFRMVTAYGRPDAEPTRADVIAFLEWCRAASASSARHPGGRG